MRSHRRRRPRWLLARTLLAVAISAALVMTGITQMYILSTDRPAAIPRGLDFVRTGDYMTRFQAWGPPSVHPVVLVHGAFESVSYWQPMAAILSRSVHVEAFDMKGYGYTDHVGPYNTEALAQQLYHFIVARHLVQPVLVGHSLGAGVIAQFVLDHPRIAAGMVFLDGDGLSLSFPGRQILSVIPSLFKTAIFRFAVRSDFLVRKVFALACGPSCTPLTAAQLHAVQLLFEVAGAQQSLLTYASQPIVGVTTGAE